MHPALRLVRIGNVLVSVIGTVIGGLAAGGFGPVATAPVLLPLGLAALSTGCVTAGGNVLNDVRDVRSDRINHPDRPLVTGAIRPGTARALLIGLLVGSVLLVLPQIPTRPAMGIILAIAVTAVLGYEFRFKASGLAGNLLVALLTGAVFLYGAASVGALWTVLPLALMAFCATLSREIIKDMEDLAGDVERRTLPRTHGLGVATASARGAAAVGIALSPVPLAYLLPPGSIVGIMYLASVLAADLLFVVSVARLPRDLHRAQSVSKAAMTVALVAFLVVALR